MPVWRPEKKVLTSSSLEVILSSLVHACCACLTCFSEQVGNQKPAFHILHPCWTKLSMSPHYWECGQWIHKWWTSEFCPFLWHQSTSPKHYDSGITLLNAIRSQLSFANLLTRFWPNESTSVEHIIYQYSGVVHVEDCTWSLSGSNLIRFDNPGSLDFLASHISC